MLNFLQKFCCRHSEHNNSPKTLNDSYRIGNMIGTPGSTAKVYIGKEHSTGRRVAIKHVNCKSSSKEVEIMKLLQSDGHPNVIKFIECFRTKQSLYIIMEKCEGDLLDLIQQQGGRFRREKDVIQIIIQILRGIECIHKHNIVHCDLKLSNILYTTDSTIKIIDFGCSQILEKNKLLSDKVGTANFIAPEVIMGEYNEQRDMWSIGCIAFILLFGYNPFNPKGNNSYHIVFQSILSGFRNTTRDGFGAFFPKKFPVSERAKEFISSLLIQNWKYRMTSSEALEHPWLSS